MLIALFKRSRVPITWTILLHILLLMPGGSFSNEKIELIPHFDKLVHFGLYFVLTAGWVLFFNIKDDLTIQQKRNWNSILVLMAIADGVIVEFIQSSPLVHRDFDWWDAVADSIGVLAGFLVGWSLSKWSKKQGGIPLNTV